MSLSPLYSSGPVVTLHAFAALVAILLGLAQLSMNKGTLSHRMIGYVWTALIAAVALSSFWIHGFRLIGPFSPIHLLSIATLVTLFRAIQFARRGDIRRHRIEMRWLFFAALLGAGAFTLLPGRVLHQVVLG